MVQIKPRKTPSYWNGEDILPTELLDHIRQYATGLIYIPASNKPSRNRRHRIDIFYNVGKSVDSIAILEGISPRRVRQILATLKQHNRTLVPCDQSSCISD